MSDASDARAAERSGASEPRAAPHGPLVVSIVARDAHELRARALAAAPGADVVELRLDGVDFIALGPKSTHSDGAADVERFLADLVRAIARPVIATVHPRATHGHDAVCDGDDDAGRMALLAAAARAGAAYVDLDVSLIARTDLVQLLPAGTRRVLSVHCEHAPAAPIELDALAAPLFRVARPGDIVKVVPRAERAEDMLLVLAWLARRRAVREGAEEMYAESTTAVGLTAFVTSTRAPLVSFASRLLAPAFGAALVYAAPDDGGALAAPGQPRAGELRAAWPAAGARATRLFGIVGRPLAHSASPRVHGAAQRALGLDALFVPLEAEDFGRLMQRLADPRWHGLSITAPFKAEALALAASADDDTRAIGAANTLVRRADGRWHASNTDAPAVLAALGAAATVPGAIDGAARAHAALGGAVTMHGCRAIVIGAGGAARAATHALSRAGAAVTVAARDLAAARALAGEVGGDAVDLDRLQARFAEPAGDAPFDIVVHATPVGTDGRGSAPVPRGLLRPGVRVLDAVYTPRRTALVRRAEAEGATAVLGEAWFLAQAEAQFARFHGLTQPLAPAARAALAAAFANHARPRPGHAAPETSCVVLLGLRCAGKSTLATGLASALGGRALDLDVELARRFVPRSPAEAALVGRPAGELLAALGEPRFRAEETAALAAVLDAHCGASAGEPARADRRSSDDRAGGGPTDQVPAPHDTGPHDTGPHNTGPFVLATGGGVVESAEARDLLASLAGRATLIWLDAPPQVLARRLAASAELRPSLTGAPPAAELALLQARRSPWYRALADVVIDASEPLDAVLANALAALP